MPITFEFTFPTEILTILLIILWFIVYGILIIGCISIRKDERNFKFVDLILVIGVAIFAYGFINKFIPRIETINPVSGLENDVAFTYNFTFFIIREINT